MSKAEANDGRRSLGAVVGENLRRLRQDRGLSQAELAGLLTAFGSRWMKSRVVALETGARESVTAGELFELSNALRSPLREFFAGDVEMPMGENGTVDTTAVVKSLNLDDYVRVDIDSPEAFESFQALVDGDFAAFELAQRLDLSVAELRRAARKLFGQNATQERADRVEQSGATGGDVAYSRRTATQSLVRELQEFVDREVNS